jgi:hypothetical protein
MHFESGTPLEKLKIAVDLPPPPPLKNPWIHHCIMNLQQRKGGKDLHQMIKPVEIQIYNYYAHTL